MSDARNAAAVTPWLALWFRPGAAIEAVLARPGEAATLALAAFAGAAGLLYELDAQLGVMAGAGEPRVLGLIAGVALLGAVSGWLGIYVTGFFADLLGRALGGVGSRRAGRAAFAWGSAPLILGPLFALGFSIAHVAVAGVVALIVGAIWSIGLISAMLARAFGLGKGRGFATYLLTYLAALCVGLVISASFRTFAFQPFSTPSGSMAPTLLVGDSFFAAKYAYGYDKYSFPFGFDLFGGRVLAGAPRRGDVVVFRRASDGSDYVKRIVGLPGETVQMIKGRLRINGAVVDRAPIEPGQMMADDNGAVKEVPTYRETLPGGKSYLIVQLQGDEGPLADTKAFVTPPDSYFVLGDNRDNSMDSRTDLGFVPAAAIFARPAMIYFSAAPKSPLSQDVRADRIGRLIE